MPRESIRTLSDLAIGDAAIVRRIRGERRTTVRLLEMGLVPGTRVELRRKAPLGDPIELRVRDYALSIRRTEALGIEVEPAAARVTSSESDTEGTPDDLAPGATPSAGRAS